MKKHTAIEALESRIAPAVLFAVEVGTNKLVSFNSAEPGTLLTDITITGLNAGEVVEGIDFDPRTGQLVGLGVVDLGANRTARTLVIDTVTGAATQRDSNDSEMMGDVSAYGFDISPLNGRAHFINSLDENRALQGAGNFISTNVDDPNQNETITAIAFDRPFGATETTLYAYNFLTDQLVTIGDVDSAPLNSESGVVNPIAKAKLNGVNFISSNNAALNFDIGGNFGGPSLGWLAVRTQASATVKLYTMDLTTAALTELGTVGDGTRLFSGLSVQTNAAAPAISADGKTATWSDLDGDAVTMKITKGTLTAANFRMLAGIGTTSALSKLTLADAAFNGTNITITAKPSGGFGDGRVNIGAIDADGIGLGAVTIGGDIQRISAEGTASTLAIKSLTAASFARFGLGLIPSAESDASKIDGHIGKVAIAGDFSGNFDFSAGKNGTLFVGGDVLGNERPGSGSIRTGSSGGLSFSKITIKGSIIGGDGAGTGRIEAQSPSIFVGGSIIGGTNTSSGSLATSSGSTITAGSNIVIGGSVLGGDGFGSGGIVVYKTSTIKIGGNLVGGNNPNAGTIQASNDGTFLKSLTIGGSVLQDASYGGIQMFRAGSITIKGSVTGNSAAPLFISATGVTAPGSAAESIAIGKITIGGSVEHARISAGNFISQAVTADAAIGAVKIGGNMIASSITAGVDSVNGKLGDGDDQLFGGNFGNAAIIAKIASITIGGQLLGTIGGAPDSFGIIAEQIGALTVGKIKLPLTAAKEDFKLGITFDVRVREL